MSHIEIRVLPCEGERVWDGIDTTRNGRRGEAVLVEFRRDPPTPIPLTDLSLGDPLAVRVLDYQRGIDEQQRVVYAVVDDPPRRLLKANRPAGIGDQAVDIERDHPALVGQLVVGPFTPRKIDTEVAHR